MSNIDNEIALIKSKIEVAQRAKIRAEATRETAQASEVAALQRLKDEFDVDNLSEARAKLAELQTDLRTKLDDITALLDEIEF